MARADKQSRDFHIYNLYSLQSGLTESSRGNALNKRISKISALAVSSASKIISLF
jgi:hypothetical protein